MALSPLPLASAPTPSVATLPAPTPSLATPPVPTPSLATTSAPPPAQAARRAPSRQRGRDPKRWARGARGGLASLALHGVVLALLSVWALPQLRGAPEAKSAHLETSWAQAARTEAAPAAPAPLLEEPAPELEEEWEPTWKDPSVEPPPAPAPAQPDPGLAAARQFRPLPPPPKASPKKAPKKRKTKKRSRRKKRSAAKQSAPKRSLRETQRAAASRAPSAPRGNVPVLRGPRVKSRPRVKYPSRCRRRGHAGKTTLLLSVDARGRVESSQVVSSAGCPRLDKAAREAGLEYRFRPGTRDGEASSWLVHVVIEFGS